MTFNFELGEKKINAVSMHSDGNHVLTCGLSSKTCQELIIEEEQTRSKEVLHSKSNFCKECEELEDIWCLRQ